MTRRKEDFTPLVAGEVRMYVCGVTPYDLSHVGHARAAVVFDVIRRHLTFKGYRVTFVRNYTDVEDKIIRRANEEGVASSEISERYIAAEREDMAAIGVWPPDVAPKATEHIPEMTALIERLRSAGMAYVVDGDVYFEVARFPGYGKLSRKNLDELLAGARVDVDERKRDPRDFALWKAAKPGEPAWPSPWGPGRPGWHIECSAMSMRYLGETLDIHGGGEDLVFPHHECEIAQSEGATRRPFSRYWLHNAFVNMGAEKMSKSLGNTLAIRDIVKRHDPAALRFWLLGTHYRHPIDFTEDRLHEAGRALQRLQGVVARADAARRGDFGGGHADVVGSDGYKVAEFEATVRRHLDAFVDAMDDDFNTPGALGAMFDLARLLNAQWDHVTKAGRVRPPEVEVSRFTAGVDALRRHAATLGLLEQLPSAPTGPPPQVEALAAERETSRRRRDFGRADALRDEIHRLGWAVEDTPAGPRLAPRR